MARKKSASRKISVIIPCFNAEATLARCLESVTGQTYRNLEIIIVDDGSTDGTRAIIERMAAKDRRIKPTFKENGGAASARNLGLDLMTGELAAFVDADDWIEPEMYSLMERAMSDNVDIVKCGVDIISDPNLFWRAWVERYYSIGTVASGEMCADIGFMLGTTVDVWSKLFRADIIKSRAIRFPEGIMYEDNTFCWTYFAWVRRAAAISDKLCHYVLSADSVMGLVWTRQVDKTRDKLKAIEHSCRYFKENGIMGKYGHFIAREVFLFLIDAVCTVPFMDEPLIEDVEKLLVEFGIGGDPILDLISKGKRKRAMKEIRLRCGAVLNAKNTPMVSVLVAVHNSSQTINRCLLSLTKQTYGNLDIVLLDDGSTDGSLTMMQCWALDDSRITVLANGKNLGVAATRNKLLKSARGEYIVFCDSDDCYKHEAVALMLEAMTRHGVDMVSCQVDLYNEGSAGDIGLRGSFESVWGYNSKYLGRREFGIDSLAGISKVLWGKMFKKSIIDKWEIDFPTLEMGEDVAFCLKYFVVSKSMYSMKERLYNYIRRRDSILGKTFDRENGVFLQNLRSFFDLVEFVKKKKITNAYAMCNELFYLELDFIIKNLEAVPASIIEAISRTLPTVVSNSRYTSCIMDIFFAADDAFAQHLAVAITSILLHSNADEGFRFHILDGGISEKNKRKLDKLRRIKVCEIEYIKVDESMFSGMPITEECKHISRATYYRYIIPRIKPGLDRSLYLDCDVAVISSLRYLWNTDFKGCYAAAVEDATEEVHEYYGKNYGVKRPFNAGVMLINNRQWRDDEIIGKLFENTDKLRDKLRWQDQDVFNYTFRGKVKFLSFKLNLQHYLFWTPAASMAAPARDIKEAKFAPQIIHYSGYSKPWLKHCGNPYWFVYFQMLKLSPFKDRYKKTLKSVLP